MDPGDNAYARLDRFIDAHYHSLLAVLLTHGHYDHIYGLLSLEHKAPVYIGSDDVRCLTVPKYNLMQGLILDNIEKHEVFDGDILAIGGNKIRVIATPFHTEGSVCYYLEKDNALISGDTLFHLSYGRTDLAGGDERKVQNSLSKLAKLPTQTKVYPGHGEATTIGNELRFNPGFSLR